MQEMAFDPADAKAGAGRIAAGAGGVCALRRGGACGAVYRPHAQSAGRLDRLLQPSAKHPRRLQLAGRVRRIAWRLTGSEFESLLAQFSLLEEIYGRKGSGTHASAGAGVCALSGRQSVSARGGDAPAQPARSRVGVWAIRFARGSGAVLGRNAQALFAAAVHVRTRSRSELSGLRVLGDEDVPGAVLQGLHRMSVTARKRKR